MHKLTLRNGVLIFTIGLLIPYSVYAYTFTQFLQKGTTSSEVRELQIALKADASIYPEGIVSGYFGLLTEKAVQKFQAKYGVVSSGTPASTGYGLVGKRTRAKLNEVLGQANIQNSPPPVNIVPPNVLPSPTRLPPPTTIISPPPATSSKLMLTSPLGSQTWKNGEEYRITWAGGSGGSDSRVNLVFEFPVNGKTGTYPLARDIANDGSELIKIPADIPAGVYKLGIYCYPNCNGLSPLDPPQNSITLGSSVNPNSTILQAPSVNPSPNYQPTVGVQNLQVVLFNFSDLSEKPFEPSVANTIFFADPQNSLKAYIQEVSYNKLILNGRAQGWFTLPKSRDEYCAGSSKPYHIYCRPSPTMMNDAVQVMNSQANISGAKYIFFVFHGIGGAAAEGVRSGGGTYSLSTISSEVVNNGIIRTIVHEMGHLLGAGHAGGWSCGNSIVGADLANVTTGCSINSRGDGEDIMGADFKHFSAAHKEKMGFLDTSQTQAVNTSGDFLLDVLETPSSGFKQLKIPLGNGNYYSIEYRKPIGFDRTYSSDEETVDGVYLRLTLANAVDEGVDTLRPREPQPLVINPGSLFVDIYHNIKIEVTEKLGNSVRIRVTK